MRGEGREEFVEGRVDSVLASSTEPEAMAPWLSQTCFKVSPGTPGCLLLAGTGRDIWGWLLVTHRCHSVLYQLPALPAGAPTLWAIKMQLFFKAKKNQASSGPGEWVGLQWFYPVAQSSSDLMWAWGAGQLVLGSQLPHWPIWWDSPHLS